MCVCVCVCVCMYIYMYVDMVCMCVCVCIYIYTLLSCKILLRRYGMCVCVCVCMCVYIYFLVAHLVKNPPAIWETWVQTLGWEDPLEKGKATLPTPVFWPGEFHGLYSPLGHKESDMTATFTFRYILFSHIILLSLKKSERMSFAATWMDLEIIILSIVCQGKTNII